ncbi:MAG: hypothetical protein QOJ00_2455 [Actinomycetota bacterium]|jgi:hypothetical protein
MFRRLFWFGLGAASGYFVTTRVQQAAKAADRLRPARMREDLLGTVKSAASQVRDAVKDLASDGVTARESGLSRTNGAA